MYGLTEHRTGWLFLWYWSFSSSPISSSKPFPSTRKTEARVKRPECFVSAVFSIWIHSADINGAGIEVRNSVTIDWAVRENVRAQMRVIIKRILRKYGYPLISSFTRPTLCWSRRKFFAKTGREGRRRARESPSASDPKCL